MVGRYGWGFHDKSLSLTNGDNPTLAKNKCKDKVRLENEGMRKGFHDV